MITKANCFKERSHCITEQFPLASTIISPIAICLGYNVVLNWLFDLPWLESINNTTIVSIASGLILGAVSLIIWQNQQRRSSQREIQALQRSAARYRAIIEERGELICRYRSDSTVSYVNDAFCDYFGIEKDQLIDREYTPVVYEADREQVQRLISSMERTNPAVTIVNRVWAKGQVRWTQWNNCLIFDEAGNEYEYQAVGRDITAFKEIEAKLKESEAKFRSAFEDSSIGEALVAPDGKFLQVNNSLCEIVGYGKTELLHKTFQEITHPEDLDLDLNYVRQMLSGEIRTYQIEKRYFQRSGSLVWVLLNVSSVQNVDGEILYFISQIQDITGRKQAEAQLNKLVNELERSNQELEEFASIVSHDLISPLHKQQMFIDLLQEDCGAALDEQGKEYLKRMTGLNFKMERLVRSLLTYARVTTQVQPFTTISLNEILNDILKELESEIMAIDAQIEVDELPIIKGDRVQIRQLFSNLLQNALKFYSPERIPKITITSPQLKDNVARIMVVDNGIGFEPEQQSKIFIPFHRLYSYHKYKSTGLGLAICEKIVKRHQGTITACGQRQQKKCRTITAAARS